MSDKIRTETIPERYRNATVYICLSYHYPIMPRFADGLTGPIFPENSTGKLQKIHLSDVTAKGAVFMPKISKKRKLEWQLFLNHRNRMTYNSLCRKCVYGCKQSFRAIMMDCPRYYPKRAKRKDHDTL